MNDRETRRYDMFGRVLTFGQNNTADFAEGGEAKKHFASLAQTLKDLDTEKARQLGGGTTSKEVLFDALRLDLQNIARTARAIAQDSPGFADSFRPPESPSQTALLTTADACIAELNKPGVAAKFIAHEMPADFAQALADDRKAIDDAKDAAHGEDNENVQSTAAIGRLIKAGMKEVNYLDAIMHNKYARNPDKLRAWQSASHIERAPQREKKAAPAPAAGSPSKQ